MRPSDPHSVRGLLGAALVALAVGCTFPSVHLRPVGAPAEDLKAEAFTTLAGVEVRARYLCWHYGGLDYEVTVINRSLRPVLVSPELIQCELLQGDRVVRMLTAHDPRRAVPETRAWRVPNCLTKHTLAPGETHRGQVHFLEADTYASASSRRHRLILPLGETGDAVAFEFTEAR